MSDETELEALRDINAKLQEDVRRLSLRVTELLTTATDTAFFNGQLERARQCHASLVMEGYQDCSEWLQEHEP